MVKTVWIGLAVLLCGAPLQGKIFAANPKPVQAPVQKPAQPVIKAEVKSVDPATIKMEPGKSVTVAVKGGNLDKVTRVAVLYAGKESGDVQVVLGAPSASAREVNLRAGANAKPGRYQIRVMWANEKIDVPTGVFAIEVASGFARKVPVAAASKPSSAPAAVTSPVTSQTAAPGSKPPSADAVKAGSSSGSNRAGASASAPVVATTDKMTVTVKPALAPTSGPVVVTTEKMTVTVKRALAPTSGPVVVTTEKMTVTVKRAASR